MANSTTARTKAAPQTAQPTSMMPILAPAIAWLIPGAGHIIQKRWIRGALLFISITTLFVLGLMMQGHIYKANGGDILDILGFIGDLGAGGMYIVTLAVNGGQGAVAQVHGCQALLRLPGVAQGDGPAARVSGLLPYSVHAALASMQHRAAAIPVAAQQIGSAIEGPAIVPLRRKHAD